MRHFFLYSQFCLSLIFFANFTRLLQADSNEATAVSICRSQIRIKTMYSTVYFSDNAFFTLASQSVVVTSFSFNISGEMS